MSCGCSGPSCPEADAGYIAALARMTSDGNTSAGYVIHDYEARRANAMWVTVTGGGIGFPSPVQQPGIGAAPTRIACFVRAVIRLERRLRVCNSMSDPTARQACIDQAISAYEDDLEDCGIEV